MTDFNSAWKQVVCMHAWEFSDAIYNILVSKPGTIIRLKPARVFSWPFQAILFQLDLSKRENKQSFTHQILFAFLSKTPGARVLDAC